MASKVTIRGRPVKGTAGGLAQKDYQLSHSNTLEGATASNSVTLNVTDASTGASGYARALWINAVISGDKTVSGEHNSIGIDQHVTGNTPYLYGLTFYSYDTGNPTIDFAAPISIYQDDLGTALGAYVCMDLGIGMSNAPADRFSYFRLRTHSTATPTSVFRCEANCATNFIDTTAGTGCPTFITTNTGTTPAGDGVLIAISHNGTQYFIKAASTWT